jgi:hypothetical protein
LCSRSIASPVVAIVSSLGIARKMFTARGNKRCGWRIGRVV